MNLIKFSTNCRTLFSCLVVGSLGLPAIAEASGIFPDRPIKVITHSGNGGGSDVTTRMMMLRARRELGQDMVIENKQGGGGAAAMKYYQSLPDDGYTILTFTVSHAINLAKGKYGLKLSDFQPLARATSDPQILMAKCGAFKSAEEFIEKQRTRAITYGVTHLGDIDDISAYTFAKKGGLRRPRMLPFDGGGTLAKELAAGKVEVGVLNLGEADKQISSGKVCPIIVLADERMAKISHVPTAKELGIPVSFATVRGFVVHASTPPEVVKKLEKALVRSMHHPIFQGFLTSIGLDSTSVAGAEVWGEQMKHKVSHMSAAMKDLKKR